MSFGGDTCSAMTHTGVRCASAATASSGHCPHHARMARVMALAPKLSPPSTPSLSPSSAHSASAASLSTPPAVALSDAMRRTAPPFPGETVVATIACVSFVFPTALAVREVPGTLYITSFRLQFAPQSSRTNALDGACKRLVDMAMHGMPRAAVAKLSYAPVAPTAMTSSYTTVGSSALATTALSSAFGSTFTSTFGSAIGQSGMTMGNGGGGGSDAGMFTRLEVKFKDLRSWVLGGDVVKLLPALNRHVFVDSPMSFFAFSSITRPTEQDAQGHALYDLYADFARMGVALGSDSSCALRVTELNATFTMCPTYPRQIVVPAAASDAHVKAVASFRSKGRLPICSYVHARNGASLWRCAQPKRGILHTQNPADEQYLLYIALASPGSPSLYSGARARKIWIADCRPELNARVNNLTGGGTESGNLAHAHVSFLNIGNIHAMRESIEAVRSLGEFVASSNNTESTDLSWGTRVEDTKWLSHVRRVLSGALQVAHALAVQATTVVVHCSDGWDRTAQLCSLGQLLVDAHYRTRRGFLEVIEKEWVRAGHKFQDRVAPGKSEDDDDQQAPIFIQFLDCVWQLFRLFPTYFEFNERMLETLADAVFSGRYGTFLGNCERERSAWGVRDRTPSLYASVLQDDRFVNPFYRASSTTALLPDIPSVLRQVTLWSSYYFRGAPFPPSPAGNPASPLYAVSDSGEGNALSNGAQEDMEAAMKAALRRIRILEDKLSAATATPPPPLLPSAMSYPPLYSTSSELDTPAQIQQKSELEPHTRHQETSTTGHYLFGRSSSDETVYASTAPSVSPHAPTASMKSKSASAQSLATTWTCSLCTKTNAAGVLQCVVCGRTPR